MGLISRVSSRTYRDFEMSLQTFGNKLAEKNGEITSKIVQQMLDENTYMIEIITDLQKQGQIQDMMKYQEKLHRNLVYLATMADQKQGANINTPPQAMKAELPSQPATDPLLASQHNLNQTVPASAIPPAAPTGIPQNMAQYAGLPQQMQQPGQVSNVPPPAGHLGLPAQSAEPNAAQMAATMAAIRGPGIPQPTASTAAQPHLAQSSVGYRPQVGFTDAQQQQAVLAAASAAASQA